MGKQDVAEYKPKAATDGAWIRQPLALLRREGGLSKAAAVLLAILIDRATDYDPPRPVSAELSALALASGYSVRTVRDALHELVRRELIRVTRTGRASCYELTGAVELLPPKRQPQQRPTQSGSRYRSRQRKTTEWVDPGYEALSNRFAPEPPEVCAAAAEPGDPDYEL